MGVALSEDLTVDKQKKVNLCSKFEGKLVSDYGRIFFVDQCRRWEIKDDKFIGRQLSQGKKVHVVGNEVIRMIPFAGEYKKTAPKKVLSRKQLCRKYEGQYLTTGDYTSIYYLERCKRRVFFHWYQFLLHRDKQKNLVGIVHPFSREVLDVIPLGLPMQLASPSYLKEEVLEMIPIDEACRNLKQGLVSYYSRIYKIKISRKSKKCTKQEITLETFLKDIKAHSHRIQELTSQQWLSIPDA